MSQLIRSWSDVKGLYANKRPEMYALVEAIESSRYVGGLYPWVSHWMLCLSQTYVEHPCGGPYLTIEPISHEVLQFRYIDTYYKHKQWSRLTKSVEAFPRLERFFKELNWFTYYEITPMLERKETR